MQPTIIFIFGLKMAGKSTIVKYLETYKIETNLNPTLAIVISKLEIKDNKYMIWDSPGQDKLRFTWKEGFEKAQVLVFVVDVADKPNMQKAKDVFESFMGEFEKISTPLVVCLHKVDLLADRANIEYAKQLFHLETKASHQLFFLETTVKSPITLDFLRVTFELLSNKAFLNKEYEFLTKN